jgi:hypothetical protein
MGEFAQKAAPARSEDSQEMWSPHQGSWPMTCAIQADPFVIFEYLERSLLNATSPIDSFVMDRCCLLSTVSLLWPVASDSPRPSN